MEKLISLVRFPNYVPGKTVAKWFDGICVTVTADFVWLAIIEKRNIQIRKFRSKGLSVSWLQVVL